MGLGGGLMTANMPVVTQAGVSHQELSIVTWFILLMLELGAAIGRAGVGALQQPLCAGLHKYLDPIPGMNGTAIDLIYTEGSLSASKFPLDSPFVMPLSTPGQITCNDESLRPSRSVPSILGRVYLCQITN